MGRAAHILTICWMVATTAHLPFPVCDGDKVGSCARECEMARLIPSLFDVDFVLLGCDEPDDPDDGPFDDDPEGGDHSAGPFPVFIGSLNTTAFRSGMFTPCLPAHDDFLQSNLASVLAGMTALRDASASILPYAATSSGTTAVMRC